MESHLYFTFWGIQTLVKGAMDKAVLPDTYKNMEEMMRKNLEKMNYPTPYQMLKQLNKSKSLHIYACSPAIAMLNIKKENLIPEVDEIIGAAAFLEIASKADLGLFI